MAGLAVVNWGDLGLDGWAGCTYLQVIIHSYTHSAKQVKTGLGKL